MKLTDEILAKAWAAFQHSNDWSRGDHYLALEQALKTVLKDIPEPNEGTALLVEVDLERQVAARTLDAIRKRYDHDPWQPIGTLGNLLGKNKE